jgi:hypothetical protein
MIIVFVVGSVLSLVYLGLSCAGRRSSKLFTVALASLGVAIVLAVLDMLVSP